MSLDFHSIGENIGVVVLVLASIGATGWAFFQRTFQKTIPFFSKWLCKKIFPANSNGLLIEYRAPWVTQDRRTSHPKIDFRVLVHNFTGYSIKIESIKFWVGTILHRQMHNFDIPPSGKDEVHFQDSLTDGEYRAITKATQFKRNEFSSIAEMQVGIEIRGKSSLGTALNKTFSRDLSFVLVEEHN